MKDIDFIRKGYLSLAEALDAFRVFPRLIVAGYSYIMYKITMWYMSLEPYMLEGCDIATLGEKCLIDAPTGMHTTLLSVMVGAASVITGLYVTSGRKWGEGIKLWGKKEEETRSLKQPEMLVEEEKDCCKK